MVNLLQKTEEICITNITDVHHFGDIWGLDILDLNDYGPQKPRGYRYIFGSNR